jgi:hypothetical protein
MCYDIKKNEDEMKLHRKALMLSLGVTWGICTLVLGWVAAFGWGDYLVDVMSSVYVGYAPGFFGGLAGGVWGFVDGAIGGFLISFFYNLFFGKKIEEVLAN